MLLKLAVFILLGGKKKYIRVVKLRSRNVLIQIEEYTPAAELLKQHGD